MKNILYGVIYSLWGLSISFSQQFEEQTTIQFEGLWFGSTDWGDYDNDNDLDLLLTGLTSGNNIVTKLYRNDGNSTFTEQSSITFTGVYLSSAAWGDYDNDGDLDLLLAGNTSLIAEDPVTKIYRNDGNNLFSEQTSILLPGIYSGSVAWADYNNDGKIDFILSGQTTSGPISRIYCNHGNNSFSNQTSIMLTGLKNSSVAWGDYDNDNDLDLLLIGQSGDSRVSKIYRNDGNNTFSFQSSIALTGLSDGTASWGDYNNDGRLDILLTGTTGSNAVTKIYKNDGSNSFSDQTLINLDGVCYSSAEWGDYDNDGSLDLFLTGVTNFPPFIKSRIYRNNGNGNFFDIPTLIPVKIFFSSASWGDFDNDQDLDLLVTGNIGDTIVTKLYINKSLSYNFLPEAPANLSTSINGNEVTFRWNKSEDNETPAEALKYNIIIGTNSRGMDVVSPMSNLQNGFNRIISLGNTNHDTSWIIRDLPNGTYYWSVQAIDNCFAGSNFSAEQSFVLPVNSEPLWQGAKSGNGTSKEFGHAITVDKWGNSYLLGTYNSPTINFSGIILNNLNTNDDIFLVKYSSQGNVAWAKTFGGIGKEYATDVDVDSLGNIFIGGGFESPSINFGTFTLYNSTMNKSADLFLVKLNSSGNVIWATSAGGSAMDVINGIAVDSVGNSFITGSYASSIITFGNTVLAGTNTDDIFIAKYAPSGNVIWARSGIGNSSYDWGNGVAFDGVGNCYVIGSFTSQNIVFDNYTLLNSNTDKSADVFIVKYDFAGNFAWAKKWGGLDSDFGQKVDVSKDGKSYITGSYASNLINFGSFTLVNKNQGLNDIYIAKLDLSGNAVWAVSGKGSLSDESYDISLDEYENIFIVGSFVSDSLSIGHSKLVNSGSNNTADIFIAKFNSQGNLLWVTKSSGNSSDICKSVAIFNSEIFFVGGSYKSNNLAFGSILLENTGDWDVFIAFSRSIDIQPFISVAIRIIPEGLYDEVNDKLNMKDTMKAYLRDISPPYAIIDSSQAVIDSLTFVGQFNFLNAPAGNYYLVINHRNSIETWSKEGGTSFARGELTIYDFTSDSLSAYGTNLYMKGSKWCIYSGDVDKDGYVDLDDVSFVYSGVTIGLTGYVISDLNGDDLVDGSDLEIVKKNAELFVGTNSPLHEF